MILYFSATGTSKYVAEQIAKATGEKIVPLKELVRQEKYSLTVPEGENFGVVMPTYWEGLPAILLDYLQKVEINLEGSSHYCFFVATYGCDYGNILSTAQKEFGKVGISFDSLYAACFVDNWSPMFYLKDAQRNRLAEENGEAETRAIIEQIMRREKGHSLPDQMPGIMAAAAKANYNRIRKTKNFRLDRENVSAAGCAPDNAPSMPLSCRKESQNGSRKNVPCASAVSTVARRQRLTTTEGFATGSMSIVMSCWMIEKGRKWQWITGKWVSGFTFASTRARKFSLRWKMCAASSTYPPQHFKASGLAARLK